MRTLLVIATLLWQTGWAQKQTTNTKQLKEAAQLVMPAWDGTNGIAVVYLPHLKQYVSGYGGNENFPLAYFNLNNPEPVGEEMRVTGIDLRTLFTKEKKLYGISNVGPGLYQLFDGYDTMPVRIQDELPLIGQKTGAYDPKNDAIIYLKEGMFAMLSLKKPNQLQDIVRWNSNYDKADYNNTTVVIKPGKKITHAGVLNVSKNTVEWYNLKNGNMEEEWQLPTDAPVKNWFNFSFANGMIWLFDTDAKTWKGYALQ